MAVSWISYPAQKPLLASSERLCSIHSDILYCFPVNTPAAGPFLLPQHLTIEALTASSCTRTLFESQVEQHSTTCTATGVFRTAQKTEEDRAVPLIFAAEWTWPSDETVGCALCLQV